MRRLHGPDRRPAARSCITPVGDCQGKQITTIEGLERDGKLHPLQQAFLDAGAMQCGYCTCGMIMSGDRPVGPKNADPCRREIVRSWRGIFAAAGPIQRIVRDPPGRRRTRKEHRHEREAAIVPEVLLEPERYEFVRRTALPVRSGCARMDPPRFSENVGGRDRRLPGAQRSAHDVAGAGAAGGGAGVRGFGGNHAAGAFRLAAHRRDRGRSPSTPAKVEVGQNARTSLKQVVAEELRICPSTSIRLVMADTEFDPFDMGTFGSGTTPRMAPQLRRAAAALRELLIDLAAERFAGRPQTARGHRRKSEIMQARNRLTFGELTKGPEADEDGVPSDARATPPAQWTTAGNIGPKS